MDTLVAAFRSVKNFLKRNWVIIATAIALISICIITAAMFPALFPMMAAKLVAVSTAIVASIAGFFSGLVTRVDPADPVVVTPVEPVVVVTPAFA